MALGYFGRKAADKVGALQQAVRREHMREVFQNNDIHASTRHDQIIPDMVRENTLEWWKNIKLGGDRMLT